MRARTSDNPAVIAAAKKHNSVLVCLNRDFADMVRLSPFNYMGIIALQVKNHPELMQRLLDYLVIHPDMISFMAFDTRKFITIIDAPTALRLKSSAFGSMLNSKVNVQ